MYLFEEHEKGLFDNFCQMAHRFLRRGRLLMNNNQNNDKFDIDTR